MTLLEGFIVIGESPLLLVVWCYVALVANPHCDLVNASTYYFDALRRRYPDSLSAFPAKTWRALILERVGAWDIEMQEQERELLQLR